MLLRHHSLLVIAMSLSLVGCQAVTSSVSSVVHKPFSASPAELNELPVSEMICLWEEAEGIGLDNKPTRGFAGQVMFFAANASEPVQVNGDVEIFLFDDSGNTEEQSKPLHTFKFEKEAFQAFKTETNLGIAYQLFLPYVRKSNYKADCNLRLRITPEEGRQLYSKMAAVNLDGPESPQAIARAKQKQSEIQLASAQQRNQPQPQQATSSEQTAAYFGATSLPKPKVTDSGDIDKQRLKLAMTEVVNNDSEPPGRLSLETQTNSAQLAPTQAAQQKHPLLAE
jgi:hypothetical protein